MATIGKEEVTMAAIGKEEVTMATIGKEEVTMAAIVREVTMAVIRKVTRMKEVTMEAIRDRILIFQMKLA
jgi:hypothetical protein